MEVRTVLLIQNTRQDQEDLEMFSTETEISSFLNKALRNFEISGFRLGIW
jgi:hypothetical protein